MEVALVTLQPENLSAELVQNFGAGGEEERRNCNINTTSWAVLYFSDCDMKPTLSDTVPLSMGNLVAHTVSPCPQPSHKPQLNDVGMLFLVLIGIDTNHSTSICDR